MRRQLKRVMASPVMLFHDRGEGTKPFPYDTLYVGLLLAQAAALAVWVVYSPL
jgi:hypothetical protein